MVEATHGRVLARGGVYARSRTPAVRRSPGYTARSSIFRFHPQDSLAGGPPARWFVIDRMRFDVMTEEENEADKVARKEREKGFKDGWSEKKWAFRAEEMAAKREIWEKLPHQWQVFDLSKDAPCLIVADSIKSSYDPKNGPITPGISAATRTLCFF